jgi:hypothetical protein
MSVINVGSVSFIQNGEPVSATVLNRALNQVITQINAYNFGGSYSAGTGISISGTTISVDGTVLRTIGNFSVSGTWNFSSVVTAVGFTTSSDKRLKDSITPYQHNVGEDVIKLKQWIWSDSEAVPEQLRGKQDSGVIADEVEAVFPSCVYVRDDGFKTVDYGKLAVHLILSQKGE